MRKAVGTIYILILLSLIGCKRMPLYDLEKVVELELELELKLDLKLDIDVKVDIEVDTVIPTPEYMKVNFYSVDNEGLNYTEFVGPQGGEINTPPGTYVMLSTTSERSISRLGARATSTPSRRSPATLQPPRAPRCEASAQPTGQGRLLSQTNRRDLSSTLPTICW